MRATAVSIACVLSATRTVSAQPCAPHAELDGDAVAVERVADELGKLGVVIGAAPGCPTVRAYVVLDESGGIAVAVRGAVHGSEGRLVSDPALAAAWIDSWAREDVDATLWAAPIPAPRVASVDEPQPAVRPPAPAPSDTATMPTVADPRISVAVDYEQTWIGGGTWTGVGGAMCVRTGSWCIGARARAAWEPDRVVNSTGMSRSDVTVLATASMPFALGQMRVAPELGLGVGRFSTQRIEGCKAPEPPINCDPADPMCEMPPPGPCMDPSSPTTPAVYVGDDFHAVSYRPRATLALRISVPLFRGVWLDGLASLVTSPFARTAPYDAKVMTGLPPELIELPGEPRAGVLLGVGVRVGGP